MSKKINEIHNELITTSISPPPNHPKDPSEDPANFLRAMISLVAAAKQRPMPGGKNISQFLAFRLCMAPWPRSSALSMLSPSQIALPSSSGYGARFAFGKIVRFGNAKRGSPCRFSCRRVSHHGVGAGFWSRFSQTNDASKET